MISPAHFGSRPILTMHSADLTGAVGSLQLPFFAENSLPRIRDFVSRSQPQNSILRKLLDSLVITANLREDLMVLDILSRKLKDLLGSLVVTTLSEQAQLMETVCALRYSLLCSPALLANYADSPATLPEIKKSFDPVLEEVLRLSALLYLSSTLQEFPFSAVGSRNMVQRLKEKVLLVRVSNRREGELMLWVLMVGGIEAEEKEKEWFREQLCLLSARLGVGREEVEKVMRRLWCVEGIHGKRGREIWREIL